MNIQEKIDQTSLDMTENQVKAFFLGVLCAEDPLPFSRALEEILSPVPQAKNILETTFEKLWIELKNNQNEELKKIIPYDANIHHFLELSKDQLDFFLTGMSLSGTHTDNCKDENLRNFINDLEDLVEDMDDLLADEDASPQESYELKNFLMEIWTEFTDSKQ